MRTRSSTDIAESFLGAQFERSVTLLQPVDAQHGDGRMAPVRPADSDAMCGADRGLNRTYGAIEPSQPETRPPPGASCLQRKCDSEISLRPSRFPRFT